MEQIRKRVSDGTFAQKERERRRRKVHMDQMRALRNQEVWIYMHTYVHNIVLSMCTVLVLYLVCWYIYICTYVQRHIRTCVHDNGINQNYLEQMEVTVQEE